MTISDDTESEQVQTIKLVRIEDKLNGYDHRRWLYMCQGFGLETGLHTEQCMAIAEFALRLQSRLGG